MISSILLQFLIDALSLMVLMYIGLSMSILSFIIIIIFQANIFFIAIGLCLGSIGYGLQLDPIYRIIVTLDNTRKNHLITILEFMVMIISSITLQLSGIYFNACHYSLLDVLVFNSQFINK